MQDPNQQVSEEQEIPWPQNYKGVRPSKSKGLRMLANIISVICHPVFFPIVMAYVIYRLQPAAYAAIAPKQVGLWFISITVTAVLFPLFSIFLMKALGFISSFKMPTTKDRIIPLMATMIFYFWVTHVFNTIPGPPLALKVLLLGNFWGIIVIFMLNIFTKISMHTTVAGAMIGIMLVLMWNGHVNISIPLLISIIIAGVVGTARLILGAHQRGDIWLGYVIGILVQLGAYVYMR